MAAHVQLHPEDWGTRWPKSGNYVWNSRNVLHIRHGLGVRVEFLGGDLRETQLLFRRSGITWLDSSLKLFQKDIASKNRTDLPKKVDECRELLHSTSDPMKKLRLRAHLRCLLSVEAAQLGNAKTRHLRSNIDEQHWFRTIRHRIIPEEMWCWLIHPQFGTAAKVKGALGGYPSAVMGQYLEAWEGES